MAANTPPQVPPRQRRDSRTGDAERMPSYYHTCVTSLDQVKQLMVRYVQQDGAFIIRRSFSRPDSFTASVMHGEGIKHFNILRFGEWLFVQEQRFSSIEEVVSYYSSHEVPNQEGVRHVRLLHPIPCRGGCVNSSHNVTASYSGSHGSSSHGVGGGGSFSAISESLPRTPSTGRDLRAQHGAAPSSHLVPPPSLLGDKRSLGSSQTLPSNTQLFPERAGSTSSVENSPGPAVDPTPAQPTCPLPTQAKRRSKFVSLFSGGKKKNTHRVIPHMEVARRPPQPLPPDARRTSPSLPGAHPGGEIREIHEYDSVRDTDVNQLPELLMMLRLASDQDSEKCECGLTLDESELPGGWSMHISHDRKTLGRLFFMGPVGQQTSWNLPLEVSLTLSADDQDRIKKVKAKCDDMQAQYRCEREHNFEVGAFNGEGQGATPQFRTDTGGAAAAGQFSPHGGRTPGVGGAVNGSIVSFSGNSKPVQHNVFTGSTADESLHSSQSAQSAGGAASSSSFSNY